MTLALTRKLAEGRSDREVSELTGGIRAKAARLRIARECPTALDLAERFDPRLVRTPALELLNRRIHEVMRTYSGRLVISIPPQEGKSTLMQWSILRRMIDNPDGRTGFTSYSLSLARKSGRIVRGHIESYSPEIGLGVARDHRDASDWELRHHRGGMYSVGVGGSFTGRPVDEGLVVDDPIKDQQDADSEAVMGNLRDWWETVALLRLAPGAWIIVIQTRWREDDLAGQLIGEGWPMVNIPALADGHAPDSLNRPIGEYLLSALGRSRSDWEKRRSESGERAWNALCQGMPSSPGGGIFLTEWFQRDRVNERPPGNPPIVVVDPADNVGDGDEAGIIVMSTDARQHIYLGPDYSGHMTTAQWVRVALLAVVRHQGAALAYEKSLSGLGRSIRHGWSSIHKQAKVLRRLAGTFDPAQIDPEVIERATAELCHRDDPESTWQQTRTELLELWPLALRVLDYPDTGPSIRLITAKGSKQLRAQMVAPLYENRRVHHVGHLAKLEHQQATWQPTQDSPDRMDAAVHACLLGSGATVATLSTPSGSVPARSTRRHGSTMIPRSTRR